jgi:HK97 family phage portal protein
MEIKRAPVLSPVTDGRGWVSVIREPHTGAWQRNQEISADTVLAHHAVYACVTLIASDVGKLRPKLVELDKHKIWQETDSHAFSPVLRKPNSFQNHIQFKEWWITSKLLRGNAYALKRRDSRKVVRELYLLDPSRVTVLVAPNGDVFYQLSTDNLSGITETSVTVPASEILHDRMNCLFHPLVGVSPIYAAGAAANVGLRLEENAEHFFGNSSNPGGILTAPNNVTKEQAERIREEWNAKYSGPQSGKVAVLGNGMKFEAMRMSSTESQMLEHLKWSAETVCSAFHVPPFKIGIGNFPTYNNGELLNQIYYSDCLQSHIESFEAVMDDGLGLDAPKDGKRLGVELDLDALLRMDTATQVTTLALGVRGAIYSPNDARRRLDLSPVAGGESPMIQQQNYSLAALAKRDASEDPFRTATPVPPTPETPDDVEARWFTGLDATGIRFKALAALHAMETA